MRRVFAIGMFWWWLLARGVGDAADAAGHWAYRAPVRPALPGLATAGATGGSSDNPIDRFIHAQLAAKGLKPARFADRPTLIRRLTFDLTGLPPTPAELDAFIADTSPDAWMKVVERLLASPRYGERMAQDWLDAARYADSNGYQVDRDRDLWVWRDWVVTAFNRNLPFDRFTIEQLAGDLLPNATLEQRIATGFNRNHMINEEGGIIPEEFLNEYCADRVETTATVWLGLTFNCARCHDHKYDPFTQRDFYGLYAFFHNITEKGVGDYGAHYRRSSPPYLKLPAPDREAKVIEMNGRAQDEAAMLSNVTARVLVDAPQWDKRVLEAKPVWRAVEGLRWSASTNAVRFDRDRADGWFRVESADTNAAVLTVEARLDRALATAWQFEFERLGDEVRNATNRVALRELRLFRTELAAGETNALALRARLLDGVASGDALDKAIDRRTNSAWEIRFSTNRTVAAVFDTLEPSAGSGQILVRLELEAACVENGFPWRVRFRATDSPLDELAGTDLLAVLRKGPADRKDDERKRLDDFRLNQSPEHAAQKRRADEAKRQATDAENALPVTLVMEEMEKPRDTFVLKRGLYDKPAEAVTPATPAALNPFPAGLPRNRLGLARWLVDPANPLTARVVVNRFWQSLFGTGLVRTPEDFGVKGEPPSHPELLDWLATELVRSGWDVKALLRLMVSSATYQQDSRVTDELRAADPDNRWLARGPRFRLSAEAIRDQALAVSGFLVGDHGGPPVRPYHPPGLYEQVVAGSSADTYVMDRGAALYRRTLYTYWKRSVPNPALLTFDRPFRETCVVRRSRTTTPLQALNLLNDPTHVEASRGLAMRMMVEGGTGAEERIRHGFRLVLAREPKPAELRVLVAGCARARAGFAGNAAGAAEFLKVGESRPGMRFDTVELAAYTVVAGTLLNLDETVTRE